MKSVVSAIAASILTALAFAPVLHTRPGVEAMALIAPKAFRSSALKAPTRETPTALVQLSPAGEGSTDVADNPNDSGDGAEADSSAQTDNQVDGGDAQNGDADNGDGDSNAQSGDNADNNDSANADNGDAGDAQSDSGDTDQSADSSATR
jgi:penicillin-binding protein 1A